MTSIALDGIALLRNLARWWRAEMVCMLRDMARRGNRNNTIFTIDASGEIRSDANETHQQSSDEAVLIVADQCFLRKKIVLPKSASKKFTNTLVYEFSRYFPVDQKTVIYAYTKPLVKNNSLETEVWAIQKKTIRQYLEKISSQFDRVYTYLYVNNASGNVSIDYSSHEPVSWSIGTGKRKRMSILVPLSIAVLLVSLPLVKLALFNYSLADEIRQRNDKLRNVIVMHEEMLAVENKIAQIMAVKKPEISLVGKLSALSESIDGKAIIKTLSIDGRQVKITGATTDISRLTTILKSMSDPDSLKVESGRTLLKSIPFEASFNYDRK